MEHITIKLPERVTACIKNHYPGSSVICAKEDTDSKGRLFYMIDLVQGDKYCHLKIADTGLLLLEESEPRFANDYHEHYY